MKYNGFYYKMFSSIVQDMLQQKFDKEYALITMKKCKTEYRRLVEEADDIGKDNPMAFNELFALVFITPYLVTEKDLKPEDIKEMMRRALYRVRWYFGLTNVNTAKGKASHMKTINKYVEWYTPEREKQYPTSFKIDFEGKPHEGACYYRITRCPICAYCKKLGVEELMPYLCDLDYSMVAMQHGILHRERTIASGGPYCDYYITGMNE